MLSQPAEPDAPPIEPLSPGRFATAGWTRAIGAPVWSLLKLPRNPRPPDQGTRRDKFDAVKLSKSLGQRGFLAPRPTVRVLIGGERLYGAGVTAVSRPDLSLRQLTTS